MRLLLHGSHTLLGPAAAADQLFLTDSWRAVPLTALKGPVDVENKSEAWEIKGRMQQYDLMRELARENEGRLMEGKGGGEVEKVGVSGGW